MGQPREDLGVQRGRFWFVPHFPTHAFQHVKRIPSGAQAASAAALFSARFLLIARLPLPSPPRCSRTLPRCLPSSLCRTPRRSANNDILPRTSAQQTSQTRTLQSGVCAKQPEVSGLIFTQGLRVTAAGSDTSDHNCRITAQAFHRNHSILPRAENEGWACVPCAEQVKGASTIQSF